MANRNMIETVEKAKNVIREEHDLTVKEIETLLNMAKKSQFDAVCTAFLYGYMMGKEAAEA